jgi:predicted nucleic-acid-binding Zn-ribbon protein
MSESLKGKVRIVCPHCGVVSYYEPQILLKMISDAIDVLQEQMST